MASRLHQVLILLFVVAIAGCEKTPSSTASAPKPGRDQKPQIYYLKDGAQPSFWWQPDPVMLQEVLSARFEVGVVSTTADAQEFLQQWNARPIDILILGPGLPQSTWLTLNLAKVSRRVVLALTPKSADSWQNVSPDERELGRFFQALCTEAFQPPGCRLIFENNAVSTAETFPHKSGPNVISLGTRRLERQPDGAPLQLSVALRWDLFLDNLLNFEKDTYSRSSHALNFASAYIHAQIPEAGNSTKNPQLSKFLENWNLKALTQHGTEQGR